MGRSAIDKTNPDGDTLNCEVIKRINKLQVRYLSHLTVSFDLTHFNDDCALGVLNR